MIATVRALMPGMASPNAPRNPVSWLMPSAPNPAASGASAGPNSASASRTGSTRSGREAICSTKFSNPSVLVSPNSSSSKVSVNWSTMSVAALKPVVRASSNGPMIDSPRRAVADSKPPMAPVRVSRSRSAVPANATVAPLMPVDPLRMPSARMSRASSAGMTPSEISSRMSMVVSPNELPRMRRASTPVAWSDRMSSPVMRPWTEI